MNKAGFRHELKYVLNDYEFAILRNRVKYVLKRDLHSKGDNYIVSSLYFDDIDDKAFYQKIDGDNDRHKYRIRCYNHDKSFVVLERKDKLNGLTRKSICVLSTDEYYKILRGDINGIENITTRPLLNEFINKLFFEKLKPSQIVEYIREPFTYDSGNVRVTFDTLIKSANPKADLFDSSKLYVSAMEKGIGILEVKYDSFIPDHIRDIVQVDNKQIQSNSKYVLCKIAMGNIK